MNSDIKIALSLIICFSLFFGIPQLAEKYQVLIGVHLLVMILCVLAYKAMESTLSGSEEDDSKPDP